VILGPMQVSTECKGRNSQFHIYSHFVFLRDPLPATLGNGASHVL
jgi:hypothetical protein